MSDNRYFYSDLPALGNFSDAIVTKLHTSLPENWWIVIADIVGSTKAIENGEYKKVNTIGVACIAAVLNVDRSIQIPFVFGGDGAVFAIPDNLVEQVHSALRGAQKLSRDSFELDLRVGLIRVGELIRQGFWLQVAKVKLSSHVTQTSLSGRGWDEAERLVKSSDAPNVVRIGLDDSGGKSEANFEGFECRWQSIQNFNGHKLSLLVAAISDDPAINLETYHEVFDKIQSIYGDEQDYHPLRPAQLHLTLNPTLLSHERRVRTVHSGLWEKVLYFIKVLFLNLAGKYLFLRNLDTEAVKWSRYRKELVENTDFRKFDGVLRMVIDGNDQQYSELEAYFETQYNAKKLVYGMHKSREALVTCLVQSYTGNHLHFVDGSDGGYAMAAQGLKQQIKSSKQV